MGENVAPPRGVRGLKAALEERDERSKGVAPPRGVRGLKAVRGALLHRPVSRRTPSRGAWIESAPFVTVDLGKQVAPPRGVRGLKGRTRFLSC